MHTRCRRFLRRQGMVPPEAINGPLGQQQGGALFQDAGGALARDMHAMRLQRAQQAGTSFPAA